MKETLAARAEELRREKAVRAAKFELGKQAYARGQYPASAELLERALDDEGPFSQLGGEIQLWLALAYQASRLRGGGLLENAGAWGVGCTGRVLRRDSRGMGDGGVRPWVGLHGGFCGGLGVLSTAWGRQNCEEQSDGPSYFCCCHCCQQWARACQAVPALPMPASGAFPCLAAKEKMSVLTQHSLRTSRPPMSMQKFMMSFLCRRVAARRTASMCTGRWRRPIPYPPSASRCLDWTGRRTSPGFVCVLCALVC